MGGDKQEKCTLRPWAFGELLPGGASKKQREHIQTVLGAKDQERDSELDPEEIKHPTERQRPSR